MARQLEVESLCAECKDILGLRLLHLELCHSPAAAPPPPHILAAAFTPAPQTGLRGKLRINGNPRVYLLICLSLRSLSSAKYIWI